MQTARSYQYCVNVVPILWLLSMLWQQIQLREHKWRVYNSHTQLRMGIYVIEAHVSRQDGGLIQVLP